MKTFKLIKNNRGFTLIETMVAILILSMALTALLGLITSSLFISRYTKNEITANYLIQEVIDSVKNKRTSSLLDTTNTTAWDSFVSEYGSCATENGCEIDVKSDSIFPCDSSDGCRFLKYDEYAENDTFYNYGNIGVTSDFKRKVLTSINTSNPDGDELLVTVTVSWMNGNEPKDKSLSISLLNWQ